MFLPLPVPAACTCYPLVDLGSFDRSADANALRCTQAPLTPNSDDHRYGLAAAQLAVDEALSVTPSPYCDTLREPGSVEHPACPCDSPFTTEGAVANG